MAELPEIHKYTAQLRKELVGRTIADVVITQPKCTNLDPTELATRARDARIEAVTYRGKWIVHTLDTGDSLLLSPGMGMDILHFQPGAPDPEKFQVKLLLDDGTGYTVKFWWFGTFALVPTASIDVDSPIRDVALDPFADDFTLDYFRTLLHGKRTAAKSLMLNQKMIGGIGNAYAHDILFAARLHPQTKVSLLSDDDVERWYNAIQSVLRDSLNKGTFFFEKDIYGEPGGFTEDDLLMGYKKGDPCSACGNPIESLKTGSTTTYLCPTCQPLKV